MITSEDIKNLTIPIITSSLSTEELIARVANLFVVVAGIIAFIYLIYSGILYITSGSSPDQARKAQQGLINVIIGIIIIAISYLVIRVVGNLVVQITQ
jgi:uncharacterized membrane protein